MALIMLTAATEKFLSGVPTFPLALACPNICPFRMTPLLIKYRKNCKIHNEVME